jgi:RNase P/RNase MRP subunit p29
VLDSSAEKKADKLVDVPPGAAKDSPSSNTARVHLEHATTSAAAPTTAIEAVKASNDPREKREFVLANGERILGHVLSETPQTIYLDHGTLGVLTLPRSQVAAKPIEVILINGDRIVGDLIAETPECLYIKHASLGMVTVPHNQRSTRVVEAILKDGDRILGEVLAETDNFTVIRSATLGTVAVQHDQVAMLNRKIEQMQLRALPSAPALEDKKA